MREEKEDKERAIDTGEEIREPSVEKQHSAKGTIHVEEQKQNFWSKEEEVSGFEGQQENLDSTPTASPDPVNPGIEQANGSSFFGNKTFMIVGIVVLVLLVLGGGFWYWQGWQKIEVEKTAQEQALATPSPTPQAAVSEKPDLSNITLQVLNGSGIPGEAGSAQELLEKEGFEEIETGNAKSFAYKLTQIYTQKETPEEVIDVVKKALGEKYALEDAVKFLDKTSEFDIQVTIGSQKAE